MANNLIFYGSHEARIQVSVNRKKCLNKAVNNPNENLVNDLLKKHCVIPFKRQRIVGNRIFDFYNSKQKIAIEVDGGEHDTERDNRIDDQLWKHNIIVFRVKNQDVKNTRALIQQLNNKTKLSKPARKMLKNNTNILRQDLIKIIFEKRKQALWCKKDLEFLKPPLKSRKKQLVQ